MRFLWQLFPGLVSSADTQLLSQLLQFAFSGSLGDSIPLALASSAILSGHFPSTASSLCPDLEPGATVVAWTAVAAAGARATHS